MMINVVAALIWRNNKLLICKRSRHKFSPLLWEFPGGKVENGETEFDALKREIKEELGVVIEAQEVFEKTTHAYDDFSIHLIFINARVVSGEIINIEHEEIRWIDVAEINNFKFCPADMAILGKIKASASNVT